MIKLDVQDLSTLAVLNVIYMISISNVYVYSWLNFVLEMYIILRFMPRRPRTCTDIFYNSFSSTYIPDILWYIFIKQEFLANLNIIIMQGITVPYMCTEDNQKYYVILSRTRILLHEWIPVLFRVRISSNEWWFRAQMSDIEIFF